MHNFTEIKNLLESHIALFDDLLTAEDKKLEAIVANDVDALDNRMKEEQAYMMRLKGLDIKREKLLEEAQLKGKTFQDLIALTEGEENAQLTMIFRALSAKISLLQSTTDSTKQYIELHLHSLEDQLHQIESQGAPQTKSARSFPDKKV